MLDTQALIGKYRAKGVFVDTNLLVLLLVGGVNIDRIQTFKRTQDFTVDDFRTLRKLILWFGAPLVATPHILSQVRDLTDLPGNELTIVRERFKAIISETEEQFDTAHD